MENMSIETLYAITEYYEDIEVIRDILYYIYNTTKDSKIRLLIEDWFDDNNYCIDCCSKLEEIERQEWHSEVRAYEYYTEMVCPCCGN